MKRFTHRILPWFLLAGLLFSPLATQGGDRTKGKTPPDKRLGPPKTLDDYFPFSPPQSKAVWEKRHQELKAQVQVANGLWPMPPKTPLHAVIHGKIQRDGYTVEKVYFASYPGFYVTGSLYRPTNIQGKKIPGVLCPHGHWTNGRFYQATDDTVRQDLKSGAEQTAEGARYPLQARCANLALMGCVVFHYDMVGYADSNQIVHREGFKDVQAELWLQSFMGLQTWDSIRALDFLLSLPEVDPHRLGVTGASGGGTQTFVLFAVDDRPTVAFPAVMVSTAMQGGCVCENCSYLRVGTGNIELAGLFAPRPLGMSGANDWTKEIETKGLPQLKDLYKLYGAEDHLAAKAWVQFPHNYNQVARTFMYNWFNKHLKLGQPEPVHERSFVRVSPRELSVWDKQHPIPKDAKNARQLREFLTQQAKEQLREIFPGTAQKLKEFRHIEGTALRVMMNDTLPGKEAIQQNHSFSNSGQGEAMRQDVWNIGRKGQGERLEIRLALGKEQKFDGTLVLFVLPRRGYDCTEVRKAALARGAAFATVSPLGVGQPAAAQLPVVNENYAGFTWGYNRTLLANRVHDILTAVAYVKTHPEFKKIHLVGFEEAGPWVLLARALCGDAVDRTAADMNQFRFGNILKMDDPMMQPGALKYGGLPAFTALAAPHKLFLHNTREVDPQGWVAAAYRAAGQPGQLHQQPDRASTEQVIGWLLR